MIDENINRFEVATLAGGCFWCLEAIYTDLKGVEKVVSGYSGGNKGDATYQEVSRGDSGHAEVVQIRYDPGIISYEELLKIFFTIHDPTTLNRQGADIGPQYRSAIFYHDDSQRAAAEEVMADLGRPNRNPARTFFGFLHRRGLPPGVFQAQPKPGLLPGGNRPQSGQISQITFADRLKE